MRPQLRLSRYVSICGSARYISRVTKSPMALRSRQMDDASIEPCEQPSDYSDWSNNDLIKRVTHLEAQLRAQNIKHSTTSPIPTSQVKKRPKKPPKIFDPSKYSTRHIALKFAYIGKGYSGFEHHANNPTQLPTVEEELWRALRKTKLILPTFKEGQSENEVCWDGCEYSKCGRTDRGVSAFGQVIGLRVRSSRPKEREIENGVHLDEDTSSNAVVEGADSDQDMPTALQPEWHPIHDELPYIQLLNRVLPSSIRILAWCPDPPPNFSARFDCRERRYRYFLTNPAYPPNPYSSPKGMSSGDGLLDIAAMQKAAEKFVGLHDFRNFCKVDPSKQITNFERRIFSASVERFGTELDAGRFLTKPPFALDKSLEMYYFEVRGSAFLWHQVRHMVAILFLVGQGYEEPEIIDRLLDVRKCTAKPVYEMADETPLVLWNCVFPDTDSAENGNHADIVESPGYEDALEWIHVGDGAPEAESKAEISVTEAMEDRKYGRLSIMEDVWAQWWRNKMDEVLAASLMDVVAQQGKAHRPTHYHEPIRVDRDSARVFDGSDTPRTVGQYIPLMQRNRMETPEVLNARYAVRKGLNGTPDSHNSDE